MDTATTIMAQVVMCGGYSARDVIIASAMACIVWREGFREPVVNQTSTGKSHCDARVNLGNRGKWE